ncbi:hypothetical protein EP232_01075 [bacterium]|nr:MAG: hypothetical protein EP232_01075 [bacterium]
MAFLRIAVILLLVSCVATAFAHMGRSIVFLCPEGLLTELAAHVVAAYMGEQMARDIEVSTRENPTGCLDSIRDRQAPMALIPRADWSEDQEGLVRVGEFLPANGTVFVLVMGEEAASNLQFSLVSKYLTRLSEGLTRRDIEDGSTRVGKGEGPRKVALDLLREADLV